MMMMMKMEEKRFKFKIKFSSFVIAKIEQVGLERLHSV